MNCKHFALTAFPFDLTPEPDALFASSSLAEAEARLKHLLELRGIGLVTGEAGSGKTTVCRKVAAALHPGLYRVFYVPLSTGNVMDKDQIHRLGAGPVCIQADRAQPRLGVSCHPRGDHPADAGGEAATGVDRR